MELQQAKAFIKDQLENYLQSKGINTRKNFSCLNPAHADRKPSMGYKNNRVHCFTCGFSGDIFDLIGMDEGLTEPKKQLEKAKEMFNITLDNSAPQFQKQIKNKQQTVDNTQQIDYTEYFKKANAEVHKTTYLTNRGLSKETINRFKLGYDPTWKHPKIPNAPATPRVIIPTSKNSYVARHTDPNVKDYAKMKVGASRIFNKKVLQSGNPVFVVEGEIDAISLAEVGAEAVALGSVSMVDSFIKECKAQPPTSILILALDKDEAGEKAAAKIEQGLQPLNIKSIKANISGKHKDPNEALIVDKDLFLQAIQEAYTKIDEIEDEKKTEAEIEREKYISENSVGAYKAAFENGINESVETPAIPTNFTELDKVLDDGLYEGLYILGAISSLGKTSFTLQLADQIAQQGQDVLIFSLEMARTELIAKSISRITFLECKDNESNAKTTRGITAGKRYSKYKPAERLLIIDSKDKYFSYAEEHIYIHEGIGDITVEYIRQTVEKHIKATGNKPVIVIDYLQILAPYDIRATDKQAIDKNVLELKKLSRKFKLPVLAISSLNRESYATDISMKAFKESGAVEYGSDVLIGLQFEKMGEDDANITEKSINIWKRKNIRKIEAKILKNRNGVTGDRITFDYYPMFNYFRETGKKESESDSTAPTTSARGKVRR